MTMTVYYARHVGLARTANEEGQEVESGEKKRGEETKITNTGTEKMHTVTDVVAGILQ